MTDVLLGLGSNRTYKGNSSLELLEQAVCALCLFVEEPVVSSVYRTKAMYVENQDDFYNMVLRGKIDDKISAHELLNRIHVIEAHLGRDRSNEIRFGPRTIDIDIELFGNECIDEPDLEVPHPRLMERAFVLIPLLEILKDSADLIDKGKVVTALENIAESQKAGIELSTPAKDFPLDGTFRN